MGYTRIDGTEHLELADSTRSCHNCSDTLSAGMGGDIRAIIIPRAYYVGGVSRSSTVLAGFSCRLSASSTSCWHVCYSGTVEL